ADFAEVDTTNCDDGPCPKNGGELTGIADLHGLPVALPLSGTARANFIGSLIAANGTELTGIAREIVMPRLPATPNKQSGNGPLVTGVAEDALSFHKPGLDGATERLEPADDNRPRDVASRFDCDDFLCGGNGTAMNGIAALYDCDDFLCGGNGTAVSGLA